MAALPANASLAQGTLSEIDVADFASSAQATRTLGKHHLLQALHCKLPATSPVRLKQQQPDLPTCLSML